MAATWPSSPTMCGFGSYSSVPPEPGFPVSSYAEYHKNIQKFHLRQVYLKRIDGVEMVLMHTITYLHSLQQINEKIALGMSVG